MGDDILSLIIKQSRLIPEIHLYITEVIENINVYPIITSTIDLIVLQFNSNPASNVLRWPELKPQFREQAFPTIFYVLVVPTISDPSSPTPHPP